MANQTIKMKLRGGTKIRIAQNSVNRGKVKNGKRKA